MYSGQAVEVGRSRVFLANSSSGPRDGSTRSPPSAPTRLPRALVAIPGQFRSPFAKPPEGLFVWARCAAFVAAAAIRGPIGLEPERAPDGAGPRAERGLYERTSMPDRDF